MQDFFKKTKTIHKVLCFICLLIYLPLWLWTIHVHNIQNALGHTPLPVFSSDSSGYKQLAENLLHYRQFVDVPGGTPQTFRTIGYPFFVASIVFLFKSYFVVTLVQIFLTFISAYFIYKIVERVHSVKWALISSILFVLEPAVVMHSLVIMSEILYVFLLTFSVYILVCHKDYKYSVFLSGVVAGLSALVRPISLFLPIFYILWFILSNLSNYKIYLKQSVLFVLGFVFMVLPWTIRNYHETGFFTFSTVSSVNIFYYNLPQFISWKTGVSVNTASADLVKNYSIDLTELGSPQNAQKFNRMGLDILKQYPFSYTYFHLVKTIPFFLSSSLKNDRYFYDLVTYGTIKPSPNLSGIILSGNIFALGKAVWGELAYSLEELFWLGIFLVMFFGVFNKENRKLVIFSSGVVLYLAIATGPVSYSRFRIPALPFIFISLPFGFDVCRNIMKRTKNAS